MKSKTTTQNSSSSSASRGSARWSQERRLEFIDYRLRWDGHLNRSDLIDFFGISVPQASLDIARYTELAPGNIHYDSSARTYLTGAQFEALYNIDNPQRYLNDLLIDASGLSSGGGVFLGWAPPVGLIPIPVRIVSAETLGCLLHAVRNQETVVVKYQSLSSVDAETRTLSPHSLVFDGFRWHVRAFCHLRQSFRDFVISRIISIEAGVVSTVTIQDDFAWHTQVSLVIAPHPDLPIEQRKVIELDYGMQNSEVRLDCRQALLFYLLKHLGFSGREATTPQAQQIILKNEDEVANYLK
ncbi:WYL domain-containing protein [Chitinibacter tainanensis]|uniref:WYL domain-containing protein n=1 Tax=Chitinibacter tainanensis TaxID=230667 RepID=UPI002354705E|nr:WYL domain-containing protein [Chitinibacter tainanensis]